MSKLGAALMVAMLVVGGIGLVGDVQSGAQPPAGGAASSGRGAQDLPFVQVNRTYSVRWQPGDTEAYTILEIRHGWARGKPLKNPKAPAEVWLNLQQAITITEQPAADGTRRPPAR